MTTCSVPDTFVADDNYLDRLKTGDPETNNHFATYFGQLLNRKLRFCCRRSPDMIEDVRQETLRRVLQAIVEGKLRNAGRLKAFVNGVCNHVVSEHRRAGEKTSASQEECQPVDHRSDPEQTFRTTEAVLHLRRALNDLPTRDRKVLTMVFFEERGHSEVGLRFSTTSAYARVLVHRAILRLRESLQAGAGPRPMTRLGQPTLSQPALGQMAMAQAARGFQHRAW